MKERVFFKTFGCRTNIYDTELLKGYVRDFELTNDAKEASIVVVNSCTVTNGADSGLKSYLHALQKEGKRVILTGCAAVSRGREFLDGGKIFGVLGAGEKARLNDFLKAKHKFYALGDLNFIDKDIVKDYENHTKAFVKIQEGCDYACAYCIIPAVRGKSRSVREENVLEQVKILVQNGYSELVLTGTNIGSYGLKEGTSLGRLLQKMGQIQGLRRIRLGSLEPAQIDESFREILDEAWLERHLHIALQHSSERMLRIMRRRSHTENDLRLFESLRAKGFALGTDFIVAHPGESEEIWQEALENFKALRLTHLHAFIFSPRAKTPSALMKNTISGAVAKERLHTLRQIVRENNRDFRARNKIPLEILIESEKNGFYEGYDQFFNKMRIKSERDLSKQWLVLEDYDLRAEFNEARA
ncbi:tRNA (N(6)-L-threonylcarbamoyladenosine(37)-C(2))-methylthiotransferase MtaB [Campylobacter sp.]|uniref:tRNA (N(6)-L-threonylcarbamoyladenosine(37)-C(2))- methylthiotransferase MtaB n=1 Tax=Campylobacter sp. TaxID=205 RepID=UPI0026DD8B7E|nr:tRNA (N(6)-L-threonylcarbamoyladenosine(37)-C(2))-methylthiotransferase MtaB [Campylobacter sp.]MDO4673926.1 tRNA (N(6)-L-threonylcarbamoyladenosine(37)-C(2))-methylthiotransferase MtaB [Campylobacter sp.]